MPVVTPPTLTTVPPFPALADRAAGTYNSKAYTFGSHMAATFNGEVAAVATNVAANATDAATSAGTATTKAATATDKAVLTAADRVQTGLDRTQTGLDAVAAAASAASAAALAGAFVGTSTSSLLIGTGSKVFATQTGEQYTPGITMSAVSAANSANYMVGQVVSYTGSTLTINITATGGSGTFADWNLSLTGAQGPAGPTGPTGGVSSVNGLTGAVTIPPTPEIITPSNASPTNASTGITETPTLTGSAYFSLYSSAQSAIQVQVHTSADFTTPLYSSGDQAAGVSFTLPAATLVISTVYYWRLRYKNSRGTYSDWSTAFSFTTAAAFTSYIATPAATPAAMGDAFEGGFYTGMIWNELVQSATSFVIGTGSKVFTVPSMSGAAIVYAGQSLEVRSRANPANKMIGTVTGASGTALTINVSSVGGSGTFTDWSIMAQYRVIVAPKASGENSSRAYKNANTAAPAACSTLTEGRKATLAMVAADTATVYPAAHWCNSLSIAGKTDWYLPARDELELCWRNLKPTADNNYATADRSDSAINYTNLGSLDDVTIAHGQNNNTSPTGTSYTTTVPAQVASGKNFRTSESEAFAYGSFYYWSASEYSATNAWSQFWHSSFPGYQNTSSKAGAFYVRAVRRSII